MQIVWLPKALDNLKEIKEYIDTESPKSAKMVAERIKKTVSLLQENPHLGKPSLVDGFREYEVSRATLENKKIASEIQVSKLPFVIPYKVIDDKIIIVRVFHTKQKPIIWE
jgi:plasmid stabilization system protein ParE